MANIASARKRARQAVRRRAHNATLRSRFRTFVRTALKAVEQNDKEAAQKAFRRASSALDSGVGKNLLHKNKAANYKRRLHRRIRALS